MAGLGYHFRRITEQLLGTKAVPPGAPEVTQMSAV
jgi:hypothetical protein